MSDHQSQLRPFQIQIWRGARPAQMRPPRIGRRALGIRRGTCARRAAPRHTSSAELSIKGTACIYMVVGHLAAGELGKHKTRRAHLVLLRLEKSEARSDTQLRDEGRLGPIGRRLSLRDVIGDMREVIHLCGTRSTSDTVSRAFGYSKSSAAHTILRPLLAQSPAIVSLPPQQRSQMS